MKNPESPRLRANRAGGILVSPRCNHKTPHVHSRTCRVFKEKGGRAHFAAWNMPVSASSRAKHAVELPADERDPATARETQVVHQLPTTLGKGSTRKGCRVPSAGKQHKNAPATIPFSFETSRNAPSSRSFNRSALFEVASVGHVQSCVRTRSRANHIRACYGREDGRTGGRRISSCNHNRAHVQCWVYTACISPPRAREGK